MIFSSKGLVIRVTDIKEHDRLLTIYTEQSGIVTALARGSRSLKSRKMASTVLFAYSDFVFHGEGDRVHVSEAELIEGFYGVRDSIDGLSLAMYICEVIEEVGTSVAERELLRLSLNSLYAISEGKHSTEKIKAAFEMRLSLILGLEPDLSACQRCGNGKGEFFFDVMAGALECGECHKLSGLGGDRLALEHEASVICILSQSARTAMLYSLYAPLEKLFSFNLGEEDMRLFSRAAEEYILNHLERGFRTLDFYNEVKR